MNKIEMLALIRFVAEIDSRVEVTDEKVTAWMAVIGHLDFDDASEAAVAHFRHEGGFLEPAKIMKGVYRIRSKRLESFVDPLPTADPSDTEAYKAELLANRKRAGSGEDISGAPELSGGPSPEVLRELRRSLTPKEMN